MLKIQITKNTNKEFKEFPIKILMKIIGSQLKIIGEQRKIKRHLIYKNINNGILMKIGKFYRNKKKIRMDLQKLPKK